MTAAVFDPYAGLLLTVALVNVALGAVVWRQSRREQNAAFALTAVFVALWALTNALFRVARQESGATLWAQLAYVAALGTGAALLHFAWSFPMHSGTRTVRRALWSGATAIAILAFVPGAMLQGVDVANRRIITAPGVYLLALFLVATLGWAFGLFWRNQARLRGRRRAQARLVLYGSLTCSP